MPTAFTSRWVLVRGRPMHALVSTRPEAGPLPLVCVHGLGAASRAQLPVARLLADDRQVFVPDLPGFGRSSAPGPTLDVNALADRLAEWADANELPPAAYLANSAGCQVVAALGERHPGLVDRLILQGPTVDPLQRGPGQQVARFLADAFVERPSLGLIQLEGAVQAGVVRLAGTFAAILADRIEARLPRLACPVLVVRGSRDALVPRRWARQAAELTGGRLEVVPGAPHCMVYSAAHELARAIKPFLDEAAVRSGSQVESSAPPKRAE